MARITRSRSRVPTNASDRILGHLGVVVHSEQRNARKHLDALRVLWCEWDPIGVMSDADWPRDEYDAYLGTTLSQLGHGVTEQELEGYLALVTLEQMGLLETPSAKSSRLEFARRLLGWYREEVLRK